MDVNFVWENKTSSVSTTTTDINEVYLLLAKAQSIFVDPFSDIEKSGKSGSLSKCVMRKAVESNTDMYAVTVNNLDFGVYHYLFFIKTPDKEWLELSDSQKITSLGSRRKVNYIELDPISPKSIESYSGVVNEYTPLMKPSTEVNTKQGHQNNPQNKKEKRRRVGLCCAT